MDASERDLMRSETKVLSIGATEAIREGFGSKVQSRLLQWIGIGISFILAAALVAIAFYFATIAFGYLDGYGLPNTALFRLFPRTERLALFEPQLGHFALMLAILGWACSWISSLDPSNREAFRVIEMRIATEFGRFGLFALVGVFLFSIGATWAGIARSQDFSSSAIAGLIPFNDAHGHFQGPGFQSISGFWAPFVDRRPLAAAFREVVVVASGFDNYHFLMLQTVALAAASYFAVSAIMSWRGVWAGMTFFGLTFIVVRPYLPTNLTEPMALFWALVAVPFIVRALRMNQLSQAAMGLHLTSWALLIRMGSMFTIPALGLWALLGQRPGRRRWIFGTAVVAGVLLGNVLLQAGLHKLYGTERGMAGSNFSYVICGLTHNTDWLGCSSLYGSRLRTLANEAEASKFLYARAFEKFAAEPMLFVRRLWDGEDLFLSKIADVVLSGYTGTIPPFFPVRLWKILALGGVLWVLLRHRERRELSFWIFILASVAVSAPFVIFDDGWRTLCTSFVLLAVLISSGFATPTVPTVQSAKETWRYRRRHEFVSIGLVVSPILLCLTVPSLAHKFDLLRSRLYAGERVGDDEDIILGARRVSGFVVLPDGVALLKEVPSMSYSSFSAIIRNSGTEQYEPLVTPSPTAVPPFAIFAAISIKQKQSDLLIAPPEMMTRLDVPAWRIRYTSGPMWRHVVEATPVVR